MSISVMGIIRFFVCLFLLLLSSASLAVDEDILSVGEVHNCVLDDTGVVCWGWNGYGQTDVPSLSNPTQVSLGAYHSCALDDTGLVCWGWNDFGQTDVPSLSNPSQVSLGEAHSCALDDTGVVCWGRNVDGQTNVPSLSNPSQVSVGYEHSCALDDSGVVCWGMTFNGQTNVPSLSNPTQVSVGYEHSCALDDTGVLCWGANSDGQIDVPALSNPTHVSSGDSHSCVFDDTGVVCWGLNSYGQTDVPSLSNPVQVSLSAYHSCALDDTGVVCWGRNDYGQTNVPELTFTTTAVDNCPNVDNPDQLDTDGDSIGDACDSDDDNDGVADGSDAFPLDDSEATDTDGDGIGNNADSDDDGDGVLDANDQYPLNGKYSKDTDSDGLPDSYEESNGLNKYLPTDAQTDIDGDGLSAAEEFGYGTDPNNDDSDSDGLKDSWEIENNQNPLVAAYQVSSGNSMTCALDDSGVVCWGNNGYGQTSVPELSNPTQLTSGTYHNCALDDSGVVCWGAMTLEEINDVPHLTNPVQVSSGGAHSCAIDDSGVVCWGYSSSGQTSVPPLRTPTQVSSGGQHSCAIDDLGIVCWGYSEYGQTTIPALTNPTQISAGGNHTCAIDNSGVVCWGDDGMNQINVPELSNPIQVSAGSEHACAIDDTGLVCWGANDMDQINVPELSNPIQVSAGNTHTCAIDDSGLVCWGNIYSQLNVPILFVDHDGDGYSLHGEQDLFPLDPNEWLDTDLDGIGNNADTDDDGDNVLDAEDLFPLDASEWADTDNDGLGDNSDNCPQVANDSQEDMDADEIGDQCDTDTDGDGVENTLDVFPFDATEALDSDADGIGNNADPDDDNDGFADINDDLPLDATEQLDTDADGIGNNTDTDDDGDGIEDGNDAFPLNELYSADSDNDGMADAWEILYGLNPNDPSDTISDQDDDGAVALQEFIEGTLPVADADNDGLSDNYEVSIGTNPNDADSDNDGVNDKDDVFPLNSAETIDTDLDGVGDLLDPDANGDGIFENHVFTLNQLQALFLSESRQTIIENGYLELGEDQAGLDGEILWRIPVTETNSIELEEIFSIEIEIEERRNFGYYEKDFQVGISDGAKVINFKNQSGSLNSIMIGQEDQEKIILGAVPFSIEGGNLSYYSIRYDIYNGTLKITITDKSEEFSPQSVWLNLAEENFNETAALSIVISGSERNESFAIKTLNVSYPQANFDHDQDGLPNDYETAYGLNPIDASDAQSDSDMDGLTALEEFTAGTNPNAKPLSQSLVGTWAFVNEVNSLTVGLYLGDSSIWASSDYDLSNMDCMFDDRIIFKADGTYQVLTKGLTWSPWTYFGYPSFSSLISTSCNPDLVSPLDLVDSEGEWDAEYFASGLEELTTLSADRGETYSLVSVEGTRAYFYAFNGEIYWRALLEKLEDEDFDGVEDTIDNCMESHNIDQKNDDNDSQGNACDLDDDNDGFEDTFEIQNGLDPLVANLDIDNDGIANELDTDNDNDGTEDAFDSFPFNALEQLDYDNDGVGNNADTDDDGDGVNDALDLFPLDSYESADSDGDGVGDNADFFPNSAEYSLDSDLDQMPDAWERKYGLNPTDASDALLDQDNDGLTALEEYEAGTIPLKILDIDANGSFDALTDGLIILRYAFGLRGQALINNVIPEDAMRNNASDIEAYINSLVPGL